MFFSILLLDNFWLKWQCMNKKNLIFSIVSLLIGGMVGSLTGYMVGDYLKDLNNKNNDYQSQAYIDLEQNNDYGTILLSKTEGNINEKVLMTISLNTSPIYTYRVKSIFYNNERIALNYTSSYYLTLKEGKNLLAVDFERVTTSNQQCSFPTLKEDYSEIDVDFELLDNQNIYSPCKINYSLDSLYSIDKIYLNDALILLDKNNEYIFLMEENNELEFVFTQGIPGEDGYNSFRDKYQNFEDYNFVEEIEKSSLALSDFAYYSYLITNSNNFITTLSYTEAISNAVFGIKNVQKVYSSYIKNNSQYFKENLTSSSYVSLGERIYLDGDVTYYRTKELDSPEYNDFSSIEPNIMKESEFDDKYHLSLRESINYNLNNTIDEKTSSIEKIEDGYILNLNLNNSAIIDYANYMVTTTEDNIIASQTDLPSFSKINLTIKIDNSLNFITLQNSENYIVYSSLSSADTVSNGSTYFFYQEEKIPSISEGIDYGELHG